MWFLDVEIFSRMIIACLVLAAVSVLSSKVLGKNMMKHLLLPADLLLVGFVSIELCVFYAAYTLLTYGFVKLLKHIKHGKKVMFALLCLACTLPFFYTRLAGFFEALPILFVLVGFSYNMLKAIDALYYTYYTDLDIPLYTYANYIMFFPVITSGPIFRYRDFEKTFNCPLPVTGELCAESIKKVIRGLFKKMVALYFVNKALMRIMYTVTPEGEKVLNEFNLVTSIAVVALCYITLYLDLSGYSDVAIGLGRITGIDVPENFKKPWCSPSFTVFWRNWHVTLSDFIREHIFVVLNGKKLNKFVSALIGFVTMLVMSLWHGFTAPFVVSGVYNGLLLAIENIFGITKSDKKKNKTVFFARCVLVCFLFGINTMLFLFDFDTIGKVLFGLVENPLSLLVLVAALVVFFAVLYVVNRFEKVSKTVKSFGFVILFVLMFFGIDTYLTYNNPFVGAPMFAPNDYEVFQYLHKDQKLDKVFFGNSTVISGFDEYSSKSGYKNLGINCGKITDLEAMLKKGHLEVEDELAIGINYLTLYDDFDTDPTYIWHKKWYQPFLYFERDKLSGYMDGVEKRLDTEHPHPFTGYYNDYKGRKDAYGSSLRETYKGCLSEEELSKKEDIYRQRYYNLPDSAFDQNIKALGNVAEYCEKQGIELFVLWMPWNPNAEYPEICDRLKDRVEKELDGTQVEIYDFTNEIEAQYFHDTGHIEFENGIPVFTEKFDELVKSRG